MDFIPLETSPLKNNNRPKKEVVSLMPTMKNWIPSHIMDMRTADAESIRLCSFRTLFLFISRDIRWGVYQVDQGDTISIQNF